MSKILKCQQIRSQSKNSHHWCKKNYAQKSAIYCCLKIEGAERKIRKNTGNIRLLIENDITGKLHNRKKWQKTSVDIS